MLQIEHTTFPNNNQQTYKNNGYLLEKFERNLKVNIKKEQERKELFNFNIQRKE